MRTKEEINQTIEELKKTEREIIKTFPCHPLLGIPTFPPEIVIEISVIRHRIEVLEWVLGKDIDILK